MQRWLKSLVQNMDFQEMDRKIKSKPRLPVKIVQMEYNYEENRSKTRKSKGYG